MKNESAMRSELAKTESPLIELREWRVALALQTEKMRAQKEALELHRTSGRGAHGVFGLLRKAK
jgi:hypothetical protein